MKDGCALWHSTAASGRAYENRCRGKNEKCISVIYTVYMESGKKCWFMTGKLLVSQKQSPRKEIRHSGFYFVR